MDRVQLYFYDDIGDWDGPSAQDVARQLLGYRQAGGVDVYINSLGGDVFEGMAIYNLLVRSGLDVTTHVDGAALSIASVIAQAGRTRRMARAGLMMVHEPAWWMGYATIEEAEQMMKPLGALRTAIADVYATRTGTDAATWLARMAETSWYSADQAIAAGLADAVMDVDQDGRLVEGQVITSQALNAARELRARPPVAAAPSGDRPPVRVAARLVAPQRALVVNNAALPPARPAPTTPTTLTMKVKDLFAKLGLSEDAEIDIDAPATPDTPATDPKPKTPAAPAAEAPATGAPAAPESDTPSAIDKLATTVNSLSAKVDALLGDKTAQAKNAFDELLAEKVKSLAVDKADEETWQKRHAELGHEVTMQLLRERGDGAGRPARVQAPTNRGGGAPGDVVMISKEDARTPQLYRAARAKAKAAGTRVVIED